MVAGDLKTEADSKASAVGVALRAARQRAGLTQAELGEFAGGVDRHLVAALERGQVTIQTQRLFQLLSALGLDLVVRPAASHQPAAEDAAKDR